MAVTLLIPEPPGNLPFAGTEAASELTLTKSDAPPVPSEKVKNKKVFRLEFSFMGT